MYNRSFHGWPNAGHGRPWYVSFPPQNVPLILLAGPPGTGKTTTIAAASRIWDLCKLPVWIVAHSNVAVKNIAETLFKKEVDYRLLVSKEFYEEWFVLPF